jgi:tryptophan synthase alpha chain
MLRMNRITKVFHDKKNPLFIAFLVAGDPDYETSRELARTLILAGADILELGMPFSDPVADGPTIQKADERALNGGMNPDRLFNMVRAIRDESEIPIVLLTYYNSVYRRGIDRFYRQARDAGIDGILIVDMPVEESDDVISIARDTGIDQIFLISATTSSERLRKIVSTAGGFLYLASTTGVTGARDVLPPQVLDLINSVRRETDLPIAVGFGISKPEHVQPLARAGANGIIVGSAIVDLIDMHLENKHIMNEEILRYTKEMKKAMNEAGHGQ